MLQLTSSALFTGEYPMTQSRANSTIRILTSSGQPVGPGILISATSALTSAQTVIAALGGLSADMLMIDLSLDFPLLAAGQVFSARVTAWDLAKDIAILEIAGTLPAGAQPEKLP
jgi:hypothetical protein